LRDMLDNPFTIDQFRNAGIVPQQLAQTIEKLIGNIEFLQMQSKLGESLQLFLPLIWKDLKEEWITFKKTGRGLADPAYTCTVNLDLERIGKLRSHVHLHSGIIHVRMFSNNPAFVNTLQDHAELLGNQLEIVGLKLGGMNITYKRDLDFSRDVSDGLDIRV